MTTLMDSPYGSRDQAEQREEASAQAVERLAGILDRADPVAIISTQVWCMEHLNRLHRRPWRTIGQYHSSFEAASMPGGPLPRLLTAYREADIVTALTEADASALREAGLPQAVAVPNPLAFWPEHVVNAGVASGRVLVLGRLSKEKAPGLLIDAWMRIADRHPSWSLHFVGSGPDEADMRARADDPRWRIRIDPPVDDPRPLLQTAPVLALPSLVEGLPLSLMEAMAHGAACIAADCSSGVRELVQEDVTGILAVRGDAEDFARGLDRLLSDPDLRSRVGMAARAHLESFRIDPVLDRWERLLEPDSD
jgi:glycosyltransferase involved in cell wall biosynthesis